MTLAMLTCALFGSLQGAPEQPDATTAARADLAARLGVAPADISAVDTWTVNWPDTSLGVPEPGRAYAQVITPGSCILLRVGDVTHAYHSGQRGRVVYAGVYREPEPVQFPAVLSLPPGVHDGAIAVDGSLVYRDREALLFDGPVDANNLPAKETPILISGPALPGFVARFWGDSPSAVAFARVVGRIEIRALDRPGGAFGASGRMPACIRADRIRVLPRQRVAVPMAYEELVRDAERLHQSVLTVQGSLVSGFEVSELGPLGDLGPKSPTMWVCGDLSGLPRPGGGGTLERAKIEVTGVFERRQGFDGTNGYGPQHDHPYRITAQSLHALGAVLDYAAMVARARELSGSLVTVRGLLFLGDGLSDLGPIRADVSLANDPGCLVAGDLSALSEAPESTTGEGRPVQVTGRLQMAATGGFGRGGTRGLRLDCITVRALLESEMPQAEGAPTGLAFVRQGTGSGGTLVILMPGATPAEVSKDVVAFALPPVPGDGRRLVVTPDADALALSLVRADGKPQVLARGKSIECPAWSPRGDLVAAFVDGALFLNQADGGGAVPAGAVTTEKGERVTAVLWSPAGDSIAYNVVGQGGTRTMLLPIGRGEPRLLHPTQAILGWLPGKDLRVAYVGPVSKPQTPDAVGSVVAARCEGTQREEQAIFRYRADEAVVALAKSPTSDVLAVAVGRADGEGPVHVYLAPMGESGVRRMLYSGASDIRDLTWAADGGSLAFCAKRGTGWRAVLLGVDGRRLVDAPDALPTRPAIVTASAKEAKEGPAPTPGAPQAVGDQPPRQ